MPNGDPRDGFMILKMEITSVDRDQLAALVFKTAHISFQHNEGYKNDIAKYCTIIGSAL